MLLSVYHSGTVFFLVDFSQGGVEQPVGAFVEEIWMDQVRWGVVPTAFVYVGRSWG